MYVWRGSGLIYLILLFQLLGFVGYVDSCSSVCTCTTIPAKAEEGESADPDAGDNDEDDGDLDIAQPPRGRKVVCSNNPYPISSLEDISRVMPLDTIKL